MAFGGYDRPPWVYKKMPHNLAEFFSSDEERPKVPRPAKYVKKPVLPVINEAAGNEGSSKTVQKKYDDVMDLSSEGGDSSLPQDVRPKKIISKDERKAHEDRRETRKNSVPLDTRSKSPEETRSIDLPEVSAVGRQSLTSDDEEKDTEDEMPIVDKSTSKNSPKIRATTPPENAEVQNGTQSHEEEEDDLPATEDATVVPKPMEEVNLTNSMMDSAAVDVASSSNDDSFANTDVAVGSPIMQTSSEKRGRGRPKKDNVELAHANDSPLVHTPQPKCRRDSPKKEDKEAVQAAASVPLQASTTPVLAKSEKRGRGRPKKEANLASPMLPAIASPDKKKRALGAPKKEDKDHAEANQQKIATPSKEKLFPGNAKQDEMPSAQASSSVPLQEMTSPTQEKRGRGRPKKEDKDYVQSIQQKVTTPIQKKLLPGNSKDDDKKSEQATSSAALQEMASPTEEKRGRGRPKKEDKEIASPILPAIASPVKQKRGVGAAKKEDNELVQTVPSPSLPVLSTPAEEKRGRGRPKSANKKAILSSASATPQETSSPEKRDRGRQKMENAEQSGSTMESLSGTPNDVIRSAGDPTNRKRVRESPIESPKDVKKSKMIEDSMTPKRGRGRPPKTPKMEMKNEDTQETATPKLKRGRPPGTPKEDDNTEDNHESSSPKRKRGRPSAKDDTLNIVPQQPTTSESIKGLPTGSLVTDRAITHKSPTPKRGGEVPTERVNEAFGKTNNETGANILNTEDRSVVNQGGWLEKAKKFVGGWIFRK